MPDCSDRPSPIPYTPDADAYAARYAGVPSESRLTPAEVAQAWAQILAWEAADARRRQQAPREDE